MTRTSRGLGLAGLALAGVVALTGCNTDAGAAALVGSTSIGTGRLASMVDRTFADPNAEQVVGTKADYQRQALGRLIQSVLVRDAAQRYGVTVTDGEVDQRLKEYADQAGGMDQLVAQAEKAGYAKSDLQDLVRDNLLQEKLGLALTKDQNVPESQLRALYQQHLDEFDRVHAAHILVKDKATAERILAQVKANPSSFAALAKEYSTDTGSAAQGGDLGWAGPSRYVQSFSDAIFKAEPGSYLIVQSQYGWHVVHVIAHQKQTFAQVRDRLRAVVLQQPIQQAMQQVLAAEAKRLGVHVNPRFGRYDASSASVVAGKDTLSKPASGSSSPPAGQTGTTG